MLNASLWGGCHWVTPGQPTAQIGYYFAVDNGDAAWTDIEKAAYAAAAQSWEKVANINLFEVSNRSSAVFVDGYQ